METFDFFVHPEYLSPDGLAVYYKFIEGDNTYISCDQLLSQMNEVGYTFDFGLDAEPVDLRPTGFENMHMEIYQGVSFFFSNASKVLFKRAALILENHLLNEGFEVSQAFAHPKGFVFKVDNLPFLEHPYTALLNLDEGELTGVTFFEAIEYIIVSGTSIR